MNVEEWKPLTALELGRRIAEAGAINAPNKTLETMGAQAILYAAECTINAICKAEKARKAHEKVRTDKMAEDLLASAKRLSETLHRARTQD